MRQVADKKLKKPVCKRGFSRYDIRRKAVKDMKTYFISIEDCQNNPVAVVKVKAKDLIEAKYKALRAIHEEDNVYELDSDAVIGYIEDSGLTPIDERGEETDLMTEDDE